MRYLLLLFALVVTGSVAAKEPRRPNILWILGDDHAPYVCGCYGNKLVRTPILDSIAAAGIRFDRAYCNSPVCTASRQSLLTGRYPRTLGVTLLKTALPEKETTLAKLFRAAGYETAAVGKMHFNSNLTHGFDLRVDHSQHREWLMQRGRTALPEGVKVLPAWKPFQDPARVWLNSEALPFGAVDADMAGSYFALRAAEFLLRPREKPFFLMVSFYEPHSPFHFPVEFRGRFKPEQFTAPKPGPEDDRHIPKIFRDLTDTEKKGIQAAYYTSVEYLDRNIGLVLAALKTAQQLDDTIIVYVGDHGYMLGQHGRFEKHCHFEPAVRAPLLLRYSPRIWAGSSTSALVEFVDLAPALLEWSGLQVPPTMQGRSLLPLAEGKTKSHREFVVSEYSENEEAMIRTERWKLIYSTGKRERQDGYTTGKPLPGRTIQLYDLENDPNETTNLASKPEQAERVKELTAKLADHMKRTARQPELIPKTEDVHVILEHCLQPRDVK